MILKIKITDIFIILIAAGLAVYSSYNAYFKPHGTLQVLIRGQDNEWFFPIDAEETVIVTGPLGKTIIKIKENHAWVESSPCENKTCMAAGYIFKQGQWAACLPNNVLLIIQGTNREDVDIIVW